MKTRLHTFAFFVLAAVIFSYPVVTASSQSYSDTQSPSNYAPFSLSLKGDILTSAAAVAAAGTCAVYEYFAPPAEWNGTLYDKSDVNQFDRFFMHKYDDSLSTISDITVGAADTIPFIATAIPLFLAARTGSSSSASQNASGSYSNLLTAAVMYSESLLIAHDTADIIKICAGRARPYMYYDSSAPQSKIDSGDWNNSFPSGHTTMAFAGAVCGSYMFCEYFPDSKWKIPVTALSLSLAASTAVLRGASGNHFATDVITGAILGSAVGFLTPFCHRVNTKTTQAAISPAGFFIRHEM